MINSEHGIKKKMPAKRIDIMDLRQLILLKQKGKSNREAAKLLHVGRNTANSYIQYLSSLDYSWQELLSMDDTTLRLVSF